MRRLVLVTALAALGATPAFAQTIQDQAPRPPPLPPEQGCELWRGTSSGNDPSVQLEVRLCPAGTALTGVIQWSSTRSGWNRRSLAGEVQAGGTRVVMRDLAILEQRPEPGWRFCTVDRYELARAGDVLAGRYDSEACTDHGRLDLRLVGTAPPGDAPIAVPPAPAPPPVTPPPPPAQPPLGCGGCAAAGESIGPVPWLAAASIGMLVRRRRRARRRAGHLVASGAHARRQLP